MHLRIFAVAIAAILLLVPAPEQQSQWAPPDDKTAKYIIDMERKWAEGVCVVPKATSETFTGANGHHQPARTVDLRR